MICIVGMPGSGKNIFINTAREFGYNVIVLGDIVREETLKRGYSLKDSGKVAEILRKEHGKAAVAKLAVDKLKNFQKIVIDGIRSYEEVKEFSRYYDCYLIAIHSSPDARFKRLLKRGREDDSKFYDEFVERDLRELRFGLGDAIALADKVIINDSEIAVFQEKCRRFFQGREENV
ncbi:MAG: AAA family ATPase [Methanomicrobia archaeon]|nr:AAA family ATPase [Methanomicrobia archaeon]